MNKSIIHAEGIVLVVALGLSFLAQGASQTWNNGSGDFLWNTTSLNWGGAAWTTGNDAVFGATGVGIVTNSGTQSIGTGSSTALTFNTAGYTITGGTLALPGAGFTSTLAVNADATIASILSDPGTSSVLKTGSGNLTLNPGTGNTDSMGSLAVQAGTLTVSSGTLNVTTSGTANSGATGNGLIISGSSSKLTIAGGTNNTTGYVSVNSGGTLSISSGTFNNGTELLNAYGSSSTVTLSGTGVLSVNNLRPSHSAGGIVNLNGGTLQMNRFIQSLAGTVNLNGTTIQAKSSRTDFFELLCAYNVLTNGAIFDTAGNNITIPAALKAGSPSGGLTKQGAGTLTLTGANTYTNTTLIKQGVVSVTNDVNLGNGGGIILSGGTLETAGSAPFVSGRAISVTSVSSINAANTAGTTLTGVITGTSTLTKSGAGTLTLDPGAGNTDILRELKTTAGNLVMKSGSVVVTNSAGYNVGSSSGATNTLEGGTLITTGGVTIIGGDIPGGKGFFNLNSGTWTNTGGFISIMYGSTGNGSVMTVNGGLIVAPDIQLGQNAGTSTLNLNGGTVLVGRLFNTSFSTAMLNLNGGTLKANANQANFLQLSGPGTVNVLTNGAVFDTSGYTVSNVVPLLAGTPSGGLAKNGNGTLILATNNTYTGVTTVNAGILKLGVSNTLWSGTAAHVASNAVLDITGKVQALSSLGGSGLVTNNSLLTVAGEIVPGGTNGIGVLTLAVPTATPLSGILRIEAAADGSCDRLHVQGGSLDISGLSLEVTGTLNKSNKYTIATCTGALNTTFTSASIPAHWLVRYSTVENRVFLTYNDGTLIRFF